MQTLLANSVTESQFTWFFPVAFALIGVLAAEIVCIVFLVRKILSAKEAEEPTDKKDGMGLSPMLILLAAQGGVQAKETWLIVLGVLALLGAVALAGLFVYCYVKGYLFVRVEKTKKPQRKISLFDFLPAKGKEEPETPKAEEDIDSAIAAFADMEGSGEQTESAPTYSSASYLDYEEELDDEEDDLDDLSDDSDADDEEPDEEPDNSDDPDAFTGTERIVGYDAETDSNIVARYRKSFEAKLIQAQPQIKRYYSEIKNTLLSYKGTKSRMSWTADSFHNGRVQIAKVNVKSRILELYLAIDPASLEGTVYRGQDVGALRKYEETPFRYKIRTQRKLNWGLELIRRACEEHGLSPIDIQQVNYEERYPFDTMDHLVKRRLVKVTTRLEKVSNTFEYDEKKPEEPQTVKEPYLPESSSVWEPDTAVEPAPVIDEPAEAEEPEKEFEEEFIETPVAESEPVIDEPEGLEEPEEEEPEEPNPLNEPAYADPLYDDVAVEAPQPAAPEIVREAPQPEPARNLNPDLAKVDVSLLDTHFQDGDRVTLGILKRRGLVLSGATRLKICASGKMSRKLTIIANQFTYDALVAISEAGGDAQFLR